MALPQIHLRGQGLPADGQGLGAAGLEGAAGGQIDAVGRLAGNGHQPLVAGPVPAEPNQSHMGNWLQCLRSRQRPNADIEFGHQHAVATIMTAVALQTGQRQKYDPVKRTISPG